MKLSFNFEDASQIFVGSFALAVPISFSEEAWRLGRLYPQLTYYCCSFVCGALGFYTYESVFQKDIVARLPVFIFRIVIAYVMTALVVALVLTCLDKLLVKRPYCVDQRVIVISMPASMGAIVVDSFDKE